MSQWSVFSPAWRFLYHVIVNCKGPIAKERVNTPTERHLTSGEDNYKSLLFSLISFSTYEVSASEVPTILKKFVSKETTSEAAILKISWQLCHVYVTSLRPTRNWQEGEKPCK